MPLVDLICITLWGLCFLCGRLQRSGVFLVPGQDRNRSGAAWRHQGGLTGWADSIYSFLNLPPPSACCLNFIMWFMGPWNGIWKRAWGIQLPNPAGVLDLLPSQPWKPLSTAKDSRLTLSWSLWSLCSHQAHLLDSNPYSLTFQRTRTRIVLALAALRPATCKDKARNMRVVRGSMKKWILFKLKSFMFLLSCGFHSSTEFFGRNLFSWEDSGWPFLGCSSVLDQGRKQVVSWHPFVFFTECTVEPRLLDLCTIYPVWTAPSLGFGPEFRTPLINLSES